MGRNINHPSEIGFAQLSDFGGYDIKEMYAADSGKVYYMNTPTAYFLSRMLRLSLAGAVIALFTWSYLTIPMIPCYVIFIFKIVNFSKWCSSINYSMKKIIGFFIVEMFLFEITAVFIRKIVIALIFNIFW